MMLLGAALTTCTVGCRPSGGPPPPVDEKQAALAEVYQLLQIPADQGKPPARKIDDLYIYENGFPAGYAAIRTGAVVVVWGVHPSAGNDGILAYSKGADVGGGWVLLQNGTTRQMTADEFQATPKAK
jgi:hypothetical protein